MWVAIWVRDSHTVETARRESARVKGPVKISPRVQAAHVILARLIRRVGCGCGGLDEVRRLTYCIKTATCMMKDEGAHTWRTPSIQVSSTHAQFPCAVGPARCTTTHVRANRSAKSLRWHCTASHSAERQRSGRNTYVLRCSKTAETATCAMETRPCIHKAHIRRHSSCHTSHHHAVLQAA